MQNSSSSSANPSGVQGICPTGWHVPSDAEWTQLTDYVGNQTQYQCDNSSDNIAKALASTTGWNSSSINCAVGNNPGTNNATGFSALPAGEYSGYDDDDNVGYGTDFWSATEGNDGNAYYRNLYYISAGVYRNNFGKYGGFSVRCVRDATLSTVTTNTVNNITSTSVTCGGNVTSDGGATVTARGVCWSTSQNPSVSDSHTTDGSGTGSFISSITGLTASTTYYVRAYATNSVGTSYGAQRSFTTVGDGDPCPGAATVTDYDNNTYNTVIIGSQCWMKENLRTTHYANGTSIELGSSTSTTTDYRYYPGNSSSNVSTYGYLYNWKAVMGGSSSSSANPSGVQGICPMGWHVPSHAEWTELTDYVGSQSQYWCDNLDYYIAKALASTTGWNSSSGTCAVSDNLVTNNATGFSALPAGCSGGSYYIGFVIEAEFWSATEYNDSFAHNRHLERSSPLVDKNVDEKFLGFSVRCVRD